MRISLLVAIATALSGCAGSNAETGSDDGEWEQEAAEDCDDVSPLLCAYVEKNEGPLDLLRDRADDVAHDVSDGMPEALRQRALLAVEFARALQSFAVPTDEALGLVSASLSAKEQCIEQCVRSEQESLRRRVSDQLVGGNPKGLFEEMRPSLLLACQPGKGSSGHVTESCLARENPTQAARTWLENHADDAYRLAFKQLVQSVGPVQQLVLFKVEMALNFASLSDKELDAMHAALVTAMGSARKLASFGQAENRAMPLRGLDPVDRWARSAAEIEEAIEDTAKKCGSGCSPAWRAAAGR